MTNDTRLVDYGAVLFDLDGVLTPTATVHARAWKEMFDGFLADWSDRTGLTQSDFDIHTDYLRYVDGKPRREGVRSFLESRGISLEYGDPEDPPDAATISGLGNRKNLLVHEVLEEQGIDPYPGSLRLLRYLADHEVKMAVVSSSHNCRAVLDSAGIGDYFEVRVDGGTADALGLAGKPEPDSFLEAARELGVTAPESVVVEDAIVGVAAGRAGGFGLVVGVDRHGRPGELSENGADVVVGDLGELVPGDAR